jgi:predicted dehydrogenase
MFVTEYEFIRHQNLGGYQMSDKLAFAVIGCGMLARSQHIPNIVRSAKACLQVCCDVDEAALVVCREQFAVPRTTTNYKDAVADPHVQAICLATTERLRLPVIEEAAKHGKSVYVEKPLARTLEEMYRIREVVKQAGIKLCVGHNRRNSPAMLVAHRIFRAHMDEPAVCSWRYDREGSERPMLPEDGAAGMSVRINDDWYSWKKWVFDKEQAPHGPMLFEMTHFTDICNWFLADQPQEVVALESGMLNHGVVIRYSAGQMAAISMCANGTFAYPKELYEAMGKGALVATDLAEVRTAGISNAPAKQVFSLLSDLHPQVGKEGGFEGWLAKRRAACADAERTGQPLLQFMSEYDRGHARAIDRFVEEIRGTGPEVCGVDSALLASRVAFAAIRAAHERRAVSIEEL